MNTLVAGTSEIITPPQIRRFARYLASELLSGADRVTLLKVLNELRNETTVCKPFFRSSEEFDRFSVKVANYITHHPAPTEPDRFLRYIDFYCEGV